MSTTRITLGNIVVDLINPSPVTLTTKLEEVVTAGERAGIDLRGLRVQTFNDLSDATPSELLAQVQEELQVKTVTVNPVSVVSGDLFAVGPQIDPAAVAMLPTMAELMITDDAARIPGTPGTDEYDLNIPPAPTSEVRAGEHDTIGELRSLGDFDAAVRAGFAPKATVYRRGTRVNSTGVANARKSRAKFEAMPDVEAGMADFIAAIQAEGRYERTVNLVDIAMDNDGKVSVPGVFENVPMEETAFGQYAASLAHACGLKAPSAYLASMTGDSEVGLALRAHNIETMRKFALKAPAQPENMPVTPTRGRGRKAAQVGDVITTKEVMVRARNNGIFALVGPKYPKFDADQVAAAVARLHQREGMKVDVNYNGTRARFDVIAQTPIAPEQFVAGEFFRVGYRIRTSDDGKGSIRVQVMIWQNLCLNLIIVDRGVVEIAAIRHKGDVKRLAEELDNALIKAQEQIGELLDRWNYAVKSPVTATAAPGHKLPETLSNEELMAGVFRSLIERDLVPVGARKAGDAVDALLAAYKIDESAASVDPSTGDRRFTRASVVNAITRVAHDESIAGKLELDMDGEDEFERAGGRLLDPKVPLLWIPSKDAIKAANEAEKAARLAKLAGG